MYSNQIMEMNSFIGRTRIKLDCEILSVAAQVQENYETFFHGLFGELKDLLLALPFKIRRK